MCIRLKTIFLRREYLHLIHVYSQVLILQFKHVQGGIVPHFRNILRFVVFLIFVGLCFGYSFILHAWNVGLCQLGIRPSYLHKIIWFLVWTLFDWNTHRSVSILLLIESDIDLNLLQILRAFQNFIIELMSLESTTLAIVSSVWKIIGDVLKILIVEFFVNIDPFDPSIAFIADLSNWSEITRIWLWTHDLRLIACLDLLVEPKNLVGYVAVWIVAFIQLLT